jgi:hypothetical protein
MALVGFTDMTIGLDERFCSMQKCSTGSEVAHKLIEQYGRDMTPVRHPRAQAMTGG